MSHMAQPEPSPQAARSSVAVWAEVLARFPDPPAAFLHAAKILVQLEQAAEADELLADGQGRYPTNAAIAIEWARAAHARRDRGEAVLRCERLRMYFPDVTFGYSFAAVCLLELRRLDEAEALINAAYRRFPDHPDVLVQDASLAHARGQFDKAIALWERIRADHGSPAGYISGVASFRESRRYDEAEALALIAVEKYPDDPNAWIQYALLPHSREDWSEAAQRWECVRTQFPSRAEGYVSGAAALIKDSRFDEAENLLPRAIELAPWSRHSAFAHAELAIRRNDWVAALARWTQAQRLFPNEAFLSVMTLQARMRLLEVDEPGPDAAAEADLPPGPLDLHIGPGLPRTSEDGTPMRDIMMAFESLGAAKFGCEFGGVQRAFGAEPLGLLRWTDMTPLQIISALEARFDGVGTPDHTEVILHEHHGYKEYYTRDKDFGMMSHTFVRETAIMQDRMFVQSCRRLQYLKDSLIDDLENGTKIFVYKVFGCELSEEELDRLYKAMQALGKNTLLCVRRSDAAHTDTTVEQVKPGLMIGYMDRFLASEDGTVLSGEAAERVGRSWGVICAAAYIYWKAQSVQ
jgi:tetratricopeptide (TPR) repeat protein